MKISNSQTGFSHLVLVLLLVIVFGGIGFAGYKVYNMKKAKPAASQPAVSTEKKEKPNTEDPRSVQEDKVETITANPFVSTNPKFSFRYPQGWIATKITSYNDSANTRIEIKSPDLQHVQDEGTQCGSFKITKGFEFSVQFENNKYSNEDIVSTVLKDESGNFTNASRTTLGGLPAVQYNQSPGECGKWHKVSTNHDGYLFMVSGPLMYENLSGYTSEFQLITSSFAF